MRQFIRASSIQHLTDGAGIGRNMLKEAHSVISFFFVIHAALDAVRCTRP